MNPVSLGFIKQDEVVLSTYLKHSWVWNYCFARNNELWYNSFIRLSQKPMSLSRMRTRTPTDVYDVGADSGQLEAVSS